MDINTTTEKTYEGSPQEVGAQLFADALGPTIAQAFRESPNPRQAVAMLAGMIAACAGQVTEFVGAQAAIEILRGTADNIEKHAPLLDPNFKGH